MDENSDISVVGTIAGAIVMMILFCIGPIGWIILLFMHFGRIGPDD